MHCLTSLYEKYDAILKQTDIKASLVVVCTWHLGKLCGRRCYVTKTVTVAFVRDGQFYTTKSELAKMVLSWISAVPTTHRFYIPYTEAFTISQYKFGIKKMKKLTFSLHLFLFLCYLSLIACSFCQSPVSGFGSCLTWSMIKDQAGLSW